jgi:tRNA-splicing ligase RtcB (3'-phosphate/5'-hydroxy nucleic acid ligase)
MTFTTVNTGTQFITKRSNHAIKKLSEFEFIIEKDQAIGMRVPVRIYANDNLISNMVADRTIDQAINVSTLPGVQKHVIILPDGHEGYGFPVGAVAGMDLQKIGIGRAGNRINGGVISPGGVGYDINCGVRLIQTNLTENEVKPKLIELVNELFRTVPSGVGGKGVIQLTNTELEELLAVGVKWAIDRGYGWNQDAEVCEENGCIKGADPAKVSVTARKRGIPQLGSLGSGNHFLEVQKVHKIYDEKAAKVMGITQQGQVTILIHCGSRGFGHQVCSDYLRVAEIALRKYGFTLPDRELACVPYDSDEGWDYLEAMNCALNFAWCNRQMIMHWARKAFEYVFGGRKDQHLDMKLVYDVAHNIAKIERHSIGIGNEGSSIRNLMVHRKGATRAFPAGMEQIPTKYRSIGQPVIIPGSMGTASWLLLGSQKSMDLSFGSTAHGAGRTMSRGAAKRKYNEQSVKKALESRGIYVKALTREGIVEETPEAYKDVDTVADISHNLGIATKVARLVPLGVIKG